MASYTWGWGIRSSFQSLIGLLLISMIVYVTQNSGESETETDREECRFMSDQLACQKFGRMDLRYQNWRWQPDQCDLPMFNATLLLERLRNKRLMFVGDSLNRGQWVSMVCLLDSSLPPTQKSMHHNASLSIFKALEYNASVEFYWAPLLVESNSDDPVRHRVEDRIVRVEAIEKHARHWIKADILIFNSYLWWRRSQMKVLWGSFERSDGIYKVVKMPRVYEMALKTWSEWVKLHIDPTRQVLFFVSMSPTHERAEEWDGVEGENCYGETEEIRKEGYRGESTCPEMMRIVDKVLNELKRKGGVNVHMINITQLSEYRKEAHPSIYAKHWGEPLTQQQLSNPKTYADCIHWCLPGLPDVWNHLFYALFLYPL
ncbi:protein trichome birefringence-like 34 isoform X2 [Euphorbia lathyris]|uniref:protein trichome birefringence-like 34 isoform X2 n=1 Tax=Euphorbia lathyris TaxID=212925 RepID=UPI003313C45B